MSEQPYIGLRSFERTETDIFFGRKQHRNDLINRLGSNHFLAVIGTSGCGKSSLVKTGLIAGLQAGYLAQANTHWNIVEMRPGNQPFKTLAENLFAELEDTLSPKYTVETLEQALRQGSLSLHELLIKHPLPNDAQLLIVCDQFEEIFRYLKHGESAEARLFVSLLLASSQAYPVSKDHSSNSIFVVITMRSDYLGDCPQFAGLAEAINQGLYLTPRLNPQQLRAAIEEPAFMFDGEIEPELVVKLLEDAEHNPDQLPLLQHILMRMWDLSENKCLTLAEYEKLGGLVRSDSAEKGEPSCDNDNDNALSRHADEVLNELSEAQKRIAKQIFCRLTNSETGKKDTRNPAKVKDLLALTGLTLEQLEEVLKPFRQAGRCFLMPPLNISLTKDSIIDISHESLIRQWQTLQKWVTEEAQAAQTYRHLLEGALRYRNKQVGLLQEPELSLMLQWRESFQPTAAWARRYGKYEEDFLRALVFLSKSEKLQHLKKIAYLLLLLMMTGLAGIASWKWKEAEKSKRLAQKQQQLAEQQQNIIKKKDIDIAVKSKEIQLNKEQEFYYKNNDIFFKKLVKSLNRSNIDKNQLIKIYDDINNPYLWRELGDALTKKEDVNKENKKILEAEKFYGKAISGYRKIIKNDPNHKVAFYYLGTVYHRLEEFDTAAYYYAKQISINPNSGYSWYHLAEVFEKFKDYKNAIKLYEKSMKVNDNIHDENKINYLNKIIKTNQSIDYFEINKDLNQFRENLNFHLS